MALCVCNLCSGVGFRGYTDALFKDNQDYEFSGSSFLVSATVKFSLKILQLVKTRHLQLPYINCFTPLLAGRSKE